MRYTTLESLEAYMRAETPPGQNETVADTAALVESIALAEESIDCFIASHLEYRSNVDEMAEIAFVDGVGWLHLQLLHPIISLTAVSMMNRDWGDTDWTTLTVKQAFPGRSPTLYPNDPPTLKSYIVEVFSSAPILTSASTGGLLVKATYPSGYVTIPAPVTALTNRYAHWVYMLREMPMGTVRDLANHSMTVPLDMPKDVAATLRSWRRENF